MKSFEERRKTLENFATSRVKSRRSNTARFVFFVRERKRERERERERETCLSSHAHGPNHDDKAQARFAFPKVLHVPHF